MKPRALDLFCCAGGATRGLQEAGFHVTGVDIHQADALTFPLEGFDFIWASPPCQAFTALRFMPTHKKDHPNLIPQTRARLVASGIPYSIENVEGAPLGDSGHLIMLCGTMFGLQTADGRAELRRHRLFETSFSIPLRPACQHGDRCRNVLTVVGHTPVDNRRRTISVHGEGARDPGRKKDRNVQEFGVQDAKEAMGIEWMTMAGLSQAIPPAYAKFIAEQMLQAH